MKKIIISILSLFLVLQGNAQLKSVGLLKDVKPDDDHYEALKNLVELYGVLGLEEARQGNNYLPARPLTHRSFAIVMVTALDMVEQRLDLLAGKNQEITKDSLLRLFRKKYFKGYSDSAVKSLSGYAQYKDVNNDDPDYTSVKKLTNYYNLKLGNTYNTFSPDMLITGKQLSQIFVEYFGVRSVVTNSSAAAVTRAKWAIYLDALMDRLYDNISGMVGDD